MILSSPKGWAGTYSVTYCANGPATMTPNYLPPFALAYGTVNGGSYGGNFGANGSPASITANSAITATLTWQPAYAGDLPPLSVIIQESCTVSASSGVSLASATGSVDDGLANGDTPTGPGQTNFQAGPTTLYQYSQSESGTVYSVQTGQNTITITRTPSAQGSCASGPTYAAVSYSVAATPVVISLNGTTQDTSGGLNILIGQGCQATLDAGSFSFGNYNWSIPGHIFASFDMAPDQSWGHETPVAAEAFTSPSPLWFWKKDDVLSVSCSAEAYVGDTDIGSVTATKSVEVWTPYHRTFDFDASISSFSPNDPSAALNLTSMSADSEPGYQFTASVGTPALFSGGGVGPGGGYGSFFFVQLINVSRTKQPVGIVNPSVTTGGFWLDNEWPYSEDQYASSTWSTPIYNVFSDTPGTLIFGCNSVSVADQFKTYLMYQPPNFGEGVQPVTLERCDWHWTAACLRSVVDIFGDYGPWSPNPPGLCAGSGNEWDYEHPHWDNVYSNQ